MLHYILFYTVGENKFCFVLFWFLCLMAFRGIFNTKPIFIEEPIARIGDKGVHALSKSMFLTIKQYCSI